MGQRCELKTKFSILSPTSTDQMRNQLNQGQYHNYMQDDLLRHDHHHPHCTAYLVDGSWGAVCMQDQVQKLFDRRLGVRHLRRGSAVLGYLVN